MMLLGIAGLSIGIEMFKISRRLAKMDKLPTASKDCWEAQDEINRMKKLRLWIATLD